jgi:hypothetical protein
MKPEFAGYFTAWHARVRRDLVKRLAMLLALPLAANWQPALANPAPVSPAGPIQIPVQCGSPTAPVKSITDALKRLGNFHPAVLLISGTCRENVTIQGLEDITLQGNPTATIDGSGNPDVGTFEIIASRNITLSNLTITGSSNDVGVDCVGFSYCLLTQVMLQNNGSGAAVGGVPSRVLRYRHSR